MLTHWGRMTHICVVKLTIIGSDNGLSPGRRQAIIWTNDGILLIGPLGTNFSEILIGIQTFSFKKMHLKMSSAKWRPFCLGLNVLTNKPRVPVILLTIHTRHDNVCKKWFIYLLLTNVPFQVHTLHKMAQQVLTVDFCSNIHIHVHGNTSRALAQ